MGATHRKVITLNEPGHVFFARAAEAFRREGWEIKNYQPNLLVGSKGMNFWTWGENYYLRQISDTEVEVSAENTMALWDPFGILKRRVRKILEAIDRVPAPPAPANTPPTPPTPPANNL